MTADGELVSPRNDSQGYPLVVIHEAIYAQATKMDAAGFIFMFVHIYAYM